MSKLKPAQSWVDAGYPDHDFAGNGELCAVCNGGRYAIQHVDWSAGIQAHDVLYLAEQYMRDLHPVLGDDYRFWGKIADLFNEQASRGKSRSLRTGRDVTRFNGLVAAAYGYLDMVKKGRG
jgi:hypothetical protein